MKRSTIIPTFMVCALVCTLGACSDPATTPVNTAPKTELLAIDLTSNYENEAVRVELDGRQVFSGTVTTNNVLSLAERLTEPVAPGEHRVRIAITSRNLVRDTTIQVQDTVTCTIRYNRSSSTIDFMAMQGLLMYD